MIFKKTFQRSLQSSLGHQARGIQLFFKQSVGIQGVFRLQKLKYVFYSFTIYFNFVFV